MPISKLNEDAELDLSQTKVLVVDDQPINIQTIYNILSPDYVVLAATSGEAALEVCKENLPDIILLDVLMPEMSGLELCEALKQSSTTRNIPIIFVTSFNEQHEEDACWHAGGVDFITKPVNAMTLKNRVKAHLTLKYQTDMLTRLVFIDGLTGIFNRRYLDNHLEQLKSAANRAQSDTVILMIDIDYFKLFNDSYGHIQGDSALKKVASIIQASLLRPSDFVSRFGGEEFAVVLPDTNIKGGLKVSERIRYNMLEERIEHDQSPHEFVTVSIGISTFLTSQNNTQYAIENADRNLYEAKKSGRNKVVYLS